MFRLGTGDVLWKVQRQYPDLFGPAVRAQVLKPLGHALVVDYAMTHSPETILEIGHGASSLTFDILMNKSECWGLDTQDKDGTVSTESLTKLRQKYKDVKFIDGYLGASNATLPSNYFDMVFSVSVIEHVPEEQYEAFFAEMIRIPKPGGVHIHSYDVYWRKDIKPMFRAIENAGFEWIEPRQKMSVFWEDWLAPRDASNPGKEITRVVFEHPYMVLEVFSHRIPYDQRTLHNWVSIHVGARKPLSDNIS